MKKLILLTAVAGTGAAVLTLAWIKEPPTSSVDSAGWQGSARSGLHTEQIAGSDITGSDRVELAGRSSAPGGAAEVIENVTPTEHTTIKPKGLIEAYLDQGQRIDFSSLNEAEAVEFQEELYSIAKQMERDLLGSVPDPASDSITAEEAWSAMESGEVAYVLPVTNGLLSSLRKPRLSNPQGPRYLKADPSADPRYLSLCMLCMEFQNSPAGGLVHLEGQRKFEAQLPPDYPFSYSEFIRTRDDVTGSTILRSPDGIYIVEHASHRIGWPHGPRKLHKF